MTITSKPPQLLTTVELSPSFNLPIILVLGALGLMFIQPVVGAVIALFGLFLMIQAVLIKLKFTPVTLEVYRGDKLIRSFPYQQWQNWEIFWQPLPILFYFKEVNSIHFLPIIFEPKTLKDCLEKCFPKNN
ncbi:MAG: DUF3119 family protein [Cyanobacterium sp. T60_A2020_053]|nr:DUF3119 family protein [Cyanobacterium sp. T60_A2020_053]